MNTWALLFPFLILACNGFFLYRISSSFVAVRGKLWWKALLFLTLGVVSNVVIWVGDPNLLYTLPVFCVIFFFCTKGVWLGRVTLSVIIFCLIMPVNAMVDTYLNAPGLITQAARVPVMGLLYLFLRKRLPPEPVFLSPRLWKLVMGLAAMPLCSLAAVVLLTYQRYEAPSAYVMSMTLGLAVLPVVLLTSVALLVSITVLAKHEALERANALASMRELYYQGLQQQEKQVRQLRHDMRNHLAAVSGLLEQGKLDAASAYLAQMDHLEGLRGAGRFCENDVANAVLAAKTAEIRQQGIRMDFSVSLPKTLPIADTDLCALLGNALDNAREGACGSEPYILLQCRLDKGLFMLRVENPSAGQAEGLPTTKPDKLAHGFGIPGMREIAERYGGTLEAGIRQGLFQLLVCLPV